MKVHFYEEDNGMGNGREPVFSQADEELSPGLFRQVEMPNGFVSQKSWWTGIGKLRHRVIWRICGRAKCPDSNEMSALWRGGTSQEKGGFENKESSSR